MLPPSSGSMNKMEAKYSFHMSVDFKRTSRRYISESVALQIGVKTDAFESPDLFVCFWYTPCMI
jgi:hypothetical protein